MAEDDFEALRSRFIELFATVPLPLRDEIVAVVDDEPISWSAAYLEVTNSTEKARKIIKQLRTIKVL